MDISPGMVSIDEVECVEGVVWPSEESSGSGGRSSSSPLSAPLSWASFSVVLVAN